MKFSKLIPELTVSSIDKTKEFYVDLLGFTIEFERKEEKFVFMTDASSLYRVNFCGGNEKGTDNAGSIIEHFETVPVKIYRNKPVEVRLFSPYGRGINFEIEVGDIDKLYEKVLSAGMEPYRKLKTTKYLVAGKEEIQREFLVMDTDGYLLRFIEE